VVQEKLRYIGVAVEACPVERGDARDVLGVHIRATRDQGFRGLAVAVPGGPV
jgi:hypothetical protein